MSFSKSFSYNNNSSNNHIKNVKKQRLVHAAVVLWSVLNKKISVPLFLDRRLFNGSALLSEYLNAKKFPQLYLASQPVNRGRMFSR